MLLTVGCDGNGVPCAPPRPRHKSRDSRHAAPVPSGELDVSQQCSTDNRQKTVPCSVVSWCGGLIDSEDPLNDNHNYTTRCQESLSSSQTINNVQRRVHNDSCFQQTVSDAVQFSETVSPWSDLVQPAVVCLSKLPPKSADDNLEENYDDDDDSLTSAKNKPDYKYRIANMSSLHTYRNVSPLNTTVSVQTSPGHSIAVLQADASDEPKPAVFEVQNGTQSQTMTSCNQKNNEDQPVTSTNHPQTRSPLHTSTTIYKPRRSPCNRAPAITVSTLDGAETPPLSDDDDDIFALLKNKKNIHGRISQDGNHQTPQCDHKDMSFAGSTADEHHDTGSASTSSGNGNGKHKGMTTLFN